MNQQEMQDAINWVLENIKGSELMDCDESMHLYVNGEQIGGWAGDSRLYFWNHTNQSAKLLRMMDVYNQS